MGVKKSVKDLKLIHAIKMKFLFAVFVAAVSAISLPASLPASMLASILSDSTVMEAVAETLGSDAVTSDGVNLSALFGGSAAAVSAAADSAAAAASAAADSAAAAAVDTAALEACTNAQNELANSQNDLETFGLKLACEGACDGIEGETCGFLVNGVSFALVALLAFLRN